MAGRMIKEWLPKSPSDSRESVVEEITDILYSNSGNTCNIFTKPYRGCGSTSTLAKYIGSRLIYEDKYSVRVLCSHERMIKFFYDALFDIYPEFTHINPKAHLLRCGENTLAFSAVPYGSLHSMQMVFSGLPRANEVFITDYPAPRTEKQHEIHHTLLAHAGLLAQDRIIIEQYYI